MKFVGETGRTAYRWKLFGWHVIIANSPMKFKNTTCGHQSYNYKKIMSERRHIAQDKCERCGRDLTVFARLYHFLPSGHPERDEIGNLRFVCNSCYKAMVRNGAPFEMPAQTAKKGGEA